MIAQDPPAFSKSCLSHKRTHQDFNSDNGSGSISNSNNNQVKRNVSSSKRVYRGNVTNGSNLGEDSFEKNQMDEKDVHQSSENNEVDTSKVNQTIFVEQID